MFIMPVLPHTAKVNKRMTNTFLGTALQKLKPSGAMWSFLRPHTVIDFSIMERDVTL